MKKVATKKAAPKHEHYNVPQPEFEALAKKAGASDAIIILRKVTKKGDTCIAIGKKGFNDPRSQHELMHALESIVERVQQEAALLSVVPQLRKMVERMEGKKAPVSKSVARRVAVQKVAKKPVTRKK